MKCDFMGRKRLRYHFHCLSDFVYRYKCHQSSQNVDLEEEFLHAAEFGDIPSVKRILDQTPEMNVDCIDALGRTALRLAVKNEHLEVNKQLMTIWMIYWSKYPTPSLTKKITAIKVLLKSLLCNLCVGRLWAFGFWGFYEFIKWVWWIWNRLNFPKCLKNG